MATHYIDIPFCSPIRFVPVDLQRDARYNFIHMDDDWFVNTIQWFEEKVGYKAKWQQNDIAWLQFPSTLGPIELSIYTTAGKLILANLMIPIVPTSIVGQLYNTTQKKIDFSKLLVNETQPLPEGDYFFYLTAGAGGNIAQSISEPLQVRRRHAKTVLIEFQHDENDYDVAWETGIKMQFRVEATLKGYSPKRITTDYDDQTKNLTRLSAVPFNKWKFRIGENRGVPPWVVEKLNFIFCMDSIWIDGKLMRPDSGQDLELNEINGYPMAGYQIDFREGKNLYSKRIFATGSGTTAVALVYNIDNWTWFGTMPVSGPVRIVK